MYTRAVLFRHLKLRYWIPARHPSDENALRQTEEAVMLVDGVQVALWSFLAELCLLGNSARPLE